MIEVIELDNFRNTYKKELREASEHIRKVTEAALNVYVTSKSTSNLVCHSAGQNCTLSQKIYRCTNSYNTNFGD